MQLSKENIKKIVHPGLEVPDSKIFELPEKVLQFGTGILLRGLPDYFIDKANKQGVFNGRIVVIKSTAKGATDAFSKQDNLYTLCIKGIDNDREVEQMVVNASISRVLSASEEWKEILRCAYNPEMKIVISNTTEVGIVESEDDIRQTPPPSFPGKLLAFLYERYKAFKGDDSAGMVIIPTELIVGNGDKLRSIVTSLAVTNKLEDGFMKWLKSANHFCNSLVDRIVPGKLPPAEQKQTEEKLGYTDELMIMAESFRLWAIESAGADKKIKETLSFSMVDAGVVIAPDIEKFRELKLRLLNGTHTLTCALALLAGFQTVKEAMNNEQFLEFVRRLMKSELVTAMEGSLVTRAEAEDFADRVVERFRNPFLEHKWASISVNYTSKMRMRNLPLLQRYVEKTGKIPVQIALGFAAYIVFMKCSPGDDGNYYRVINENRYLVDDEAAAFFSQLWAADNVDKLVDTVLRDKGLWGADLTDLHGFAQVIKENIRLMEKNGVALIVAN